jgi:hypothetical protein
MSLKSLVAIDHFEVGDLHALVSGATLLFKVKSAWVRGAPERLSEIHYRDCWLIVNS